MSKLMLLLGFLYIGLFELRAQNEYSKIDNYISNYQFTMALFNMSELENTDELLFRKVTCYKGLDDYSKAIEILLYIDSTNLKTQLELAECYQALSRWDESLKCYEYLEQLDSTNTYYKIRKADMFVRLEDYKQALILYQTLSSDFGMSNMIKRSAQCFENLAQLDSAKLYYKKAIDANPNDVFSVASLTNLYLKKTSFSEAIDLSNNYIAKDSTNKQMNVLNALSYYGADLYDEAIDRFYKCYLKGDSSLLVNRSLGISYYSLGENEACLPFLEKAYAQDSTNNRVLYCLSVAYNETRNYDKSVLGFEKLLERSIPSNMVLYLYYRGLAKGCEGNNDYKNAVVNYIKASNYGEPNQNMYLHFTLGTIYDYDLEKPALALEYYKKYRIGLEDYLANLKSEDQVNEKEIKGTESTIVSLDTRITRLEKTLTK